MNRIEEMIKEMCPDGVKKYPLWSLTAWDKNFKGVDKSMQPKIIKYNYLLASELFSLEVPNGNVKLLSTGVQEGWTTIEKAGNYLSEGEIVSIPWGKSQGAKNPIKYYNGKFVTADNRIATSLNTSVLNNKFLYYWMLSISDDIDALYRGASIMHPDMKEVLNLQIPLPPLPIQQEIVRILDSFTALQQNLEDELKLRQKQYEHYREKLLTFEDGEVEWKKLNEICDVINGRAYKQSELLDNGPYRVLRVGNFFSNDSWYYSDLELESKYYCEKGDLLYAWSASFGPHLWEEEKVIYHYHIWKLDCKEIMDKKYFFYWLQSENMTNQVSSEKHGATMAHLTKALMERLIVPVPPLDRQLQITQTLDHFESLISNLKTEIELRKKQYEYYREKLLTF